ncbi:unnamed protein product [Linum trigynum]|uniref:Retrotransposon Copia-like N-terminal domain-containing protein n=1 Tax=Linum trigynum TaxID=586398 RepID=A0AAV2F738_9ROSI
MGDDETSKNPQTSSAGLKGEFSMNQGFDVTSEFFLHPSDINGQLQVSEVLTSSNYGEWVVDVTNALIVKNKFGFVDGSIPQHMADPELKAWSRCDAFVKGWLRISMDKEVQSSVRYAKTEIEVWIDLKQRFGQGILTRGYELRHMLSGL